MDVLPPRDNSRRSVALCLFLPAGPEERSEASASRRWDSFSRRCRARSFFRFAASVPSSSPLSPPLDFCFLFDAVGPALSLAVGGLDDYSRFEISIPSAFMPWCTGFAVP